MFFENGREAEYGKNVLDRLIGASGLLLTEKSPTSFIDRYSGVQGCVRKSLVKHKNIMSCLN